MKILKLKLQAFGPFLKEQEIDFTSLNDKGMFLINGATGSGKTSIFDAIVFALYGKASGGDRAGDSKALRSDYATDDIQTFVELTFSANGDEYVVLRRPPFRKENNKSDTQGYAELKNITKNTIISGVNNVDKAIVDNVLYMNREQFKMVALLAQGEFTELINAKSDQRAAILEHIFGKEIYQNIQDKIDAVYKDALKAKDAVITSINTLIAQIENGEDIVGYKEALGDPNNIPTLLENLLNFINEKEAILAQLEQIEKEKESAHNAANDALVKLKDKNNEIKKYLAARQKLEELESKKEEIEIKDKKNKYYAEYLLLKPLFKSRNDLDLKSKRIDNQINDAVKELEDVKVIEKKLVDNLEEYERDKVELEEIKKDLILLNEINKERQDLIRLKQNVELEEKEYEKKFKEFSAIEAHYLEIKKAFFASISYNLAKDLSEGEPCPVCGSTSHPNPATAHNPVSEAELNIEEKKYNTADKKLRDEWASLASHKESLEEREKELIKKLLDLGFEDASIEFIYSNEIVNRIASKKQRQTDLELFINNYEKEKTNYDIRKQKAEQNHKQLCKQKDELKTEIQDNEKDIKAQFEKNAYVKKEEDCVEFYNVTGRNKEIEEVRLYESEMVKNKAIVDNTADELKNIGLVDESELINNEIAAKEELNKARNDKNALSNLISSLNRSYKAISQKYSECKDTLDRFSSISELNKTVSGNNKLKLSFKMYILADYFEKIILKANLRLRRITNDNYRLLRRSDIRGRGLQGLDLDVYDAQTGKERAASSLSGGEKFVTALSLALGLSDIIEENGALVQVESIFIDEGFGSLDNDVLDMAMQSLSSLRSDNKIVAIISHVEKLNEYISSGLEVEKTDSGSVIKFKNYL